MCEFPTLLQQKNVVNAVYNTSKKLMPNAKAYIKVHQISKTISPSHKLYQKAKRLKVFLKRRLSEKLNEVNVVHTW